MRFWVVQALPGVEGDLKGLVAPCHKDIRGDAQMGAAVFGVLSCLFDLPFSLLVDPLALPYDLYQVSCGGKRRSGYDHGPKLPTPQTPGSQSETPR